MIYGKDFLKQLDQTKNKTIYAKIISLDFNERPQSNIEGKITSGSINIDGASAVRRTCQISLVTKEVDIADYYWSLNTKFKVEIGVKNTIDNRYPDIIWFKQGTYLITSFSQALSTNGYTINISGKDKMCQLNGENGGSLQAQTDFGQYEEILEDGTTIIAKYPLKQIIRDMVHHYAQEPFHNIIINDLDATGLELQEYRYDSPLYLIRKASLKENPKPEIWYINGTLDGDLPIWIKNENSNIRKKTTISNNSIVYDSLLDTLVDIENKPTQFYLSEDSEDLYAAAKISYGQTVGYTETELVYNGELIGNVGETITSILDKIKNMLGNYEYFYDLDGRFIFQKQKNYINSAWTPIVSTELANGQKEEYVESYTYSSPVEYEFLEGSLITAFNNTPNLAQLKNDYCVWGAKKTSSGGEVAIHMRYAIDDKPLMYRSIQVLDSELEDYNSLYNTKLVGQNSCYYISNELTFEEYAQEITEYKVEYNETTQQVDLYGGDGLKVFTSLVFKQAKGKKDKDDEEKLIIKLYGLPNEYKYVDWREIIYQMALDYRKYGHLDNFEQKVAEANREYGLYLDGKTGYEQYYIDLEGFWRQLYDYRDHYTKVITPQAEDLKNYYFYTTEYKKIEDINNISNGTKVYQKMIDGTYMRAVSPWKSEAEYYTRNEVYSTASADTEIRENVTYYSKTDEYYPINHKNAYWNRMVYIDPSQLNFWFDFLDVQGELEQFSVKKIGARPKMTNDKSVKAIYYKDTPLIIFRDSTNNHYPVKSGYKYFNVNAAGFAELFSRSAQGKTAKDAIDGLLYNHASCIESVAVTTIPIYYLEPNTIVYIKDSKSGIDGNYSISKLTIPLTYNGTMNITATKAVKRLY